MIPPPGASPTDDVLPAGPVVAPAGDPRLSLLIDIGLRLTSLRQVGDLLQQIVDEAARVMDAAAASLMLLSDDGQALIFEVAYGEKGGELKGMRMAVDDSSIAGWVARHGRLLVIDDVTTSPFFSGKVDRTINFTTQSMLCVPLAVKDRVIGVVEVLNRVSGTRFGTEDAALLTALAGIAGIAIDNARLLEEATRRADELARLLAELRRTYRGTMYALSTFLDIRDAATAGHSQRVVIFTLALARALGITDPQRLRVIEYGALLHDVGKIGTPDAILLKPGPLTAEEWGEMRRHPARGAAMLADIDFLAHAVPIVRWHHERWDGTGYPDGLAGEAIPPEARIFAVADVFDALTSERTYHAARSYAEACAIIRAGSGTHFDPAVADAFCRVPEAAWTRLRARVASATRYEFEFDAMD